MWKYGLEPIITHDTEILILGSLPSDESIKQQRYYAKPNNDFWKLIGETIGKNLIGIDYKEKCRILTENKIGLWDVFHKCERAGSLDSDIKGGELNDFSRIKAAAPNIKLVCFNGKTAGESEKHFIEKGYKTKVLPSSSGANRINSEARLQEWKSIICR